MVEGNIHWEFRKLGNADLFQGQLWDSSQLLHRLCEVFLTDLIQRWATRTQVKRGKNIRMMGLYRSLVYDSINTDSCKICVCVCVYINPQLV